MKKFRGRKSYKAGNKIPKELKKPKTLHDAVLYRWAHSRVKFDYDHAMEWTSKAPESDTASHLLAWAERHPFLKVTRTPVPSGIIPFAEVGLSGATLIDIVVAPPKCRGPRIIDDDVYDAFPYLRTYVPRGLCILETKPIGGATEHKVVIFAMKKFTGGPGDDDDFAQELESVREGQEKKAQRESAASTSAAAEAASTNPTEGAEGDDNEAESDGGEDADDAVDASDAPDLTPTALSTRWEHYFIEPHTNATRLVCTSKENGDAAHFSAVKLGNRVFYIMGSKNVHLLVSDNFNSTDVSKYLDTRFVNARNIAQSMLTTLSRVDQSAREQFVQYVITNQVTATLEYLSVTYQHVELFDFTESKFRFIAFTSNENLRELCTDLEESVAVASRAGFETVSLSTHAIEQQDELFASIRSQHGKEGSVVYYISQSSPSQPPRVIGMVKKKSMWYILVRSIREKMKGLMARIQHPNFQGTREDFAEVATRVKKALRTTLKQKQEWLGLRDETRNAWEQLAAQCVDWLLRNAAREEKNVGGMFPVVWNKFLQETDNSDQISFP